MHLAGSRPLSRTDVKLAMDRTVNNIATSFGIGRREAINMLHTALRMLDRMPDPTPSPVGNPEVQQAAA